MPGAGGENGAVAEVTPALGGTVRPQDIDRAHATVAAATDQLALTALRIGLLLLAAATFGDGWVALAAGQLDAGVSVVGLVILTPALVGVSFPGAAASLLRPRGRVFALALGFAVLGLVGRNMRTEYADVEFGLASVAAIVASPLWAAGFIAVSLLGMVADFLATGHGLPWTLQGPGVDQLASQCAVMVAGAAVWVGVVWILRRTITTAPASLQRVRSGAGDSLTPRLAAAVRAEPAGLLVRADASALVESLSAGERQVLELLVDGLLPKQAAHALELALPTVRSRIASAKRKTGARTLEQLVGLYAEGDAS